MKYEHDIYFGIIRIWLLLPYEHLGNLVRTLSFTNIASIIIDKCDEFLEVYKSSEIKA